jgi:hypothetical protein
MTTFHSRQSGDARRTRKNENADTFNFVPQIAPSICAVMHTKHDKRGATIFKSLCKRTVVCKCFYRVEALPLVWTRFSWLAKSSPMIQRSPARWTRNGQVTSGKIAVEMSHGIAAQLPGNGRCNATGWPGRWLARQLATSHATVTRCPSKPLASWLVGIPPTRFRPSIPKLMNSPTKPPSTPDLESLRKAILEYQPDPHRIPFSNLKPFHDSIVELRGKNASYAAIADLLIENGVKTSRARVAEYGRIVLEGGKSRRRRKRARTAPVANTLASSQSAPAMTTKPAPAITAPTSNVSPPPTENSPFTSRGPRIANVRMMSPEQAKEFNASLKPGNTPKQ